MLFLVRKARLFYLEKILKDFLIISSNKRGEIIAKLKAAKQLNDEEINNIKKDLTENFGTNLKLNFEHDPSLIGGLIIQIGSVMIDTSIKNKLQQLENKNDRGINGNKSFRSNKDFKRANKKIW